MITKNTNKCKENGRHAAMLEIPERVYEECQDKLKKVTVESHQTIMLTLPIGRAPFRQYYPKRIRARSRFEGVSTPRNVWNRGLRTKTAVEQTSSTSTSKREEENQDITCVAQTRRRGIRSHFIHDAWKRWSTKKLAQTYKGFAD